MAQLFRPGANTIATVSLFLGAAAPFALFLTGSQITRSPANTGVKVPIDQPIPFSHAHHAYELGIDCRFCHVSVENSAKASLPASDVCMTCHSQIWTNSPLLDPLRTSYEKNIPIEWNKVNKVPDFVYFDHSIHIDRGISCNNCHGPVQEMHKLYKGNDFRMSWCVECHTDPSKFLYQASEDPKLTPRQQIFQMYKKISAGQPLTPVEHKLAEGLAQRAPNDKAHEGVALMRERGINVSQLTDCYICHR